MSLRRLFVWLGLLALVILAIANLGKGEQFIQLLGQIKWYVLVLVVAVQLLSYYSNAKYYQSFFRLQGYEIPLKKLYQISLALNFVNQAFPSGGISGMSFIASRLKDGVPPGKATLAQIMRYGFTYLSFVIVLVLGFLFLFLAGGESTLTVKVTLLVILLIIILSVIFMVLVGERSRVEALADRVTGLINGFGKRVLRRKSNLIYNTNRDRFIDEFYQGYELLLHKKGSWHGPLFYAFTGNLAEVLTIYAVFLAFGKWVNIGAVIAAYTLANLFSTLGFITSGAGVYEATMVGAFAALGFPLALSVSVVLVYRFFNALIFLPFGFHYYRTEL